MKVALILQRCLALLLCFAISPLPALCQQAQEAGNLSNLDTVATRNGTTAHQKDVVLWNDLLKTDHSGRARVALRDGSSLSLGSDSELKVVQHDAVSQQTTLQMLLGRVRAQVVKLTTPNSKFEVNTPHATLGVIGTDFNVEVTDTQTNVIVYSGIVRVTRLQTSAGDNSNTTPGQSQSVTLSAGQTVSVTATGIGVVGVATNALIQSSITNTLVKGVAAKGATTAAVAGSHVLRNILIGLGVAGAAGAVAGIVVSKRSSGSGPSIPAQ